MKNTPRSIFDLSQETALSLSKGAWPKFLRTAAWNYKYDFPSQLLIYAQKPESTACASYEVWTSNLFQRMPRRGTGIALITDDGPQLGIRYVFDFSDTFVQKGAAAPSVPIWEVTEGKERFVREALGEEHLPYEQHTDLHLNSSPEDFYRSIAAAIVREQCHDSVRAIWEVQETCDLKSVSQIEAERNFRDLLVESVSAILQYRCGHEPKVREPIMALAEHFNSTDAISVLGTATQTMARQALLEVAHAVKQWDNEHEEEIQHDDHIPAGRGASDPEPDHSAAAEMEQIRADAQDISERAQAQPVHQLASERRTEPTPVRDRGEDQAASGRTHGNTGEAIARAQTGGHSGQYGVSQPPSDASGGIGSSGNDFHINEEDIRRAITIGPPLPGGKFRLYAAATDQYSSPERLIDVMHEEYGTGSRAFMLSSGLDGKLSWGVSGLEIAQIGLQEGEHFALGWKNASEWLKTLVEADFYLSSSEKVNMDRWKEAQKALQERQKTGAVLSVYFAGFDPDRQALNQTEALIHAYVYENSDAARQALAGKLLHLSTLESVRSDSDAQELFHTLSEALSIRIEDEHTLPSATDAGIINPFPAQENPALFASGREQEALISTETPAPDSTLRGSGPANTRKGVYIDIANNQGEAQSSSPSKALKQNHLTENDAAEPKIGYSEYSIHTLRTAISDLLSSRYEDFLRSLENDKPADIRDSDELNAALEDFIQESSIYAAEDLPEQVEQALRTPDFNCGVIAAAAFQMRDRGVSDIADAGREALLMLSALYRTDEETLFKAASGSGRINPLNNLSEIQNETSESPNRKVGPSQRNYTFLQTFAPAILDGTLDYLRFETEGFEPLFIERQAKDRIAIAHTFVQNGDLCYDPIVTFHLDRDKKELQPLSFEQSSPPFFDDVYDDMFKMSNKDPEAELRINDFLTLWFSNLSYQGHEPVRGVKNDRGGDKEYIFVNGNMVPVSNTETPNEVRHPEPLIDHPELRSTDQSRLARKDKVALADLLYHFSTYRYTFISNTPDLSDRDTVRREEQLAQINEMLVSTSVEENLENIRKAKSILTRWFLPFEGIRPDILAEQERLILAAEQVLLDPPAQDQNPKHVYEYEHEHAHIEPVEAEDIAEDQEETLFDFETAENRSSGPSKLASLHAFPLFDDAGRINHRTADLEPHYGGPKERFQNNIAAISLLKELERAGRLATVEEQEILSRYVGWGGLSKAFDPEASDWSEEYNQLKELLTCEEYEAARASTLTAFYTPPVVIDAMYNGIRQLGIDSGNLLDAGCGTGAFFGQAPEKAKLFGVEIDPISGRIAQQLYQQADIAIEGFENTSLPDNFFNCIVGNVPFGNFKVFDRKYNKYNFQIHDFFFAKGLDKLRPGGVLALITSAGTMDKQDEKFRRYLAEHADLIGAVRLPNNTFRENAGTDVTSDILFLRKREHPRVDIPDWVHTSKINGGHSINNYFLAHRDMVLGDIKEVSGPFGPQVTCVSREGEALKHALAGAIRHIRDEARPTLDELDDPAEDTRVSIPADPDVANYSFTVIDDEVYYREDAQMFRRNTGKTQASRIKGMVQLRNTVRQLIQAQLDDKPDAKIHQLQKLLNDQYDDFTKKHGLINSRGNQLAFSDDNSYYLLCSLEQLDQYGNFAGKADIFFKRTISAYREVKHVDTPYEALLVSIGERGRVDLAYMERLSGIDRSELLISLEDQIYEDPGRPGTYLLAATYLSGNVREKLRQAQTANEREPGRYDHNIKALEQAIPEPLGPGDISIQLGATWVPPDIIRDFMYETFRTDPHNREKRYIDVDYSPILNQWAIKNKGWEKNSVAASSTYGTAKMDAYTILEHTLNLKDVRIYKENPNDPDKRTLDSQETILAQEKQALIKNAFQAWVWEDPQRANRLCSLYNEKFNSFRPPKYDGSILTFHGMSPTEELRQNQKDVVARILFSGNTLIAAAVGAGKTWMMTAAAMEGKYLGHCSKSMIAVPNHLIKQWTKDIYKLYPSANVLAVTEKDFEPKNRKKFCSRIATGDYDIILIAHSQLEKIPLSVERQKAYIEEQIDEIVEGIRELKEEQNQHFTVKQMESKKKSLERTLKKLTESKRRDDVVTFEELGVDRLFIDESDEFKNLFLHTKMQNVAGIAQTDAQKASDLFLKCRYMDELTGGKGNIHATGTPLSNTMAEIYTEQRYLQYETLKELGLHHFDSWLSSFGEAKPVLELAPEGTGYRMRNRLTNFYNLPELMGIYRQIAEIQTQDMLDIPLPNVHYITISVPPSKYQKAMVQHLADRAEAIRNGGVNSEKDNMLCVVNDGRKLALDQRLLVPSLPDDPNNKVNAVANEVYQDWTSGKGKHLTQLVFCDISTPKTGEFNVYDALRDKLVEKGIPCEEVRFIHEATTDIQKENLFAQVRDGTVRVLIGSTGKMGTGTNVQDLLMGSHDMDCPWRPRDLTQREGRTVRFGNTNDDVYIRRYVTEGTFDAYMYQLLESKQRLISQIFTGENPARQIEDMDEMTMSFAEIKGIASGNPLIKEKVELQLDISKLETLKARHLRNQSNIANLVSCTIPTEIKSEQALLKRLNADITKLNATPARTADGKYIAVSVFDHEFETATESGMALLKALDELPADKEFHCVGHYRGFELIGSKTTAGDNPTTSLMMKGIGSYPIGMSDKGLGMIQRLNNVLDSLPDRAEDCQSRLSQLNQKLADYKEEMGKPFLHEDKLQKKLSRMKELDNQLNLELNSVLMQGRGEAAEEKMSDRSTETLADKITDAQIRAVHGTGQALSNEVQKAHRLP